MIPGIPFRATGLLVNYCYMAVSYKDWELKKNTQYKIKSDLNAWKQLCELLKESRATENKPANELDLLLSKFFISVRKQNGTEYEPGNEYDPASRVESIVKLSTLLSCLAI